MQCAWKLDWNIHRGKSSFELHYSVETICHLFCIQKTKIFVRSSSFHPPITDVMPLNSGCIHFSSHIHRARKHFWSIGVVKYSATTHWVLSLRSCHVLCEAFHRLPGVNFRPIKNRQIQQCEYIYTAEFSVVLKNPIPGHHWSKCECIMWWH